MAVIRPVPAQALQRMRLPRSRMWPVPQHRSQVCCMTGGGRLLCAEKRLPNSTETSFGLPIMNASGHYRQRVKAPPGDCVKCDGVRPRLAFVMAGLVPAIHVFGHCRRAKPPSRHPEVLDRRSSLEGDGLGLTGRAHQDDGIKAITLSSSAKADDPVLTDVSCWPAFTGCPAFAGHDSEIICHLYVDKLSPI
jgi:hypothetical protein